jgi:hypothetical protein
MIIQYDIAVLAPGGLLGEPSGFRVNGTQLTDEAKFFRAVAETWFARLNASTEVAFTVSRSFPSLKLAQTFCCLHRNSLQGQGDLTLTLGEGGDVEQVVLPRAVLKQVELTHEGLLCKVQYTFGGGLFSQGS